jgi:hypothetical protein
MAELLPHLETRVGRERAHADRVCGEKVVRLMIQPLRRCMLAPRFWEILTAYGFRTKPLRGHRK